MTIGTLLLGFVITGTLLAIDFSGQENYGSGELVVFFKWAGLCTICSGVAVIVAFNVSVNGLHSYTTSSAKHGLRILYRSTMAMLLSEICLYLAILTFIWTLQTFVYMNYSGPDICVGWEPALEGHEPAWQRPSGVTFPQTARPLAICGQLGSDIYTPANETCGGPRPLRDILIVTVSVLRDLSMEGNPTWSSRSPDSEDYLLCSVFDYYNAMTFALFGKQQSIYYPYDIDFLPGGVQRDRGSVVHSGSAIWRSADLLDYVRWYLGGGSEMDGNAAGSFASAFFMENLDTVTNLYCRRDEARTIREELCNGPLRSPEERSACSNAMQSFVVTDKCVGDLQKEALQCHDVCSHSMYHWDMVEVASNWVGFFSVLAVSILGCFRVFYGVQHIEKARNMAKCMNLEEPSLIEAEASEANRPWISLQRPL